MPSFRSLSLQPFTPQSYISLTLRCGVSGIINRNNAGLGLLNLVQSPRRRRGLLARLLLVTFLTQNIIILFVLFGIVLMAGLIHSNWWHLCTNVYKVTFWLFSEDQQFVQQQKVPLLIQLSHLPAHKCRTNTKVLIYKNCQLRLTSSCDYSSLLLAFTGKTSIYLFLSLCFFN